VPTDTATRSTVEELPHLLKACGRGDEEAFSRLYDAVSSRLFGLVLRVVRDRAQAEEVTQDAFLDIWRHAARYDPDRGSALSWMLTIGHRKAVDRVRSAEASTRRDTTYHDRNQPIDHDTTADAVDQVIDLSLSRLDRHLRIDDAGWPNELFGDLLRALQLVRTVSRRHEDDLVEVVLEFLERQRPVIER